MRKSDFSENLILSILEDNTKTKWNLFVKRDKDGNEIAQYKEYDPPYKLSYPDFEGRKNGILVCLVEVKYHVGDFDGRKDVVAIKEKNLKHYSVVQRKERVPLQIVFVVFDNKNIEYYWEEFPYIWNIKPKTEMYTWNYFDGSSERVRTRFYNKYDFRTDIENLGIV